MGISDAIYLVLCTAGVPLCLFLGTRSAAPTWERAIFCAVAGWDAHAILTKVTQLAA